MGKLSFLDDEMREWIDWRWGWLDNHIGMERMRAAKVPVSTAELVQGDALLTPASSNELAKRICQAMGIQGHPVRLIVAREETGIDDPEYIAEFDAALKENTSLVIGIDTNYPGIPHQAAVQFYPMIAHAYLHRMGAMDPMPWDHRLLDELAAIQLGGGALLANNELVTDRSTFSLIYTEQTVRLSDLATQSLGYALARFAYDRQEQSPEWGRKLRADPKDFYKRSLAAFKTQPPETRDQPPLWYTDAEREADPGEGIDEGWSPEELKLANPEDSKPPERPIYCRNCAYRVSHLPAGDCPECGQPFDPEDMASITMYKPEFTSPLARKVINFLRRFLLLGLVVFCLFVMCFVVLFLLSTLL